MHNFRYEQYNMTHSLLHLTMVIFLTIAAVDQNFLMVEMRQGSTIKKFWSTATVMRKMLNRFCLNHKPKKLAWAIHVSIPLSRYTS